MNFTIDTIKNHLSSTYREFKTIENFFLLQDNNNTTIFVIITKQGKYILKHYHDSSSLEKIDKMCVLLSKWKKKIPVEEPLKNSINQYVDKKYRFYITKFYEGSFFSNSISQLYNLANTLAIFHKVLLQIHDNYNFCLNQTIYKSLNNKELLYIKKNLTRPEKSKFDKVFLKNFNYISEELQKNYEFFSNMNTKKFPKQLIHFDLHPKNILFCNSNVKAIIDFSTLRRGYVLEDVLFCAFRFSIIDSSNIHEIYSKMKKFLIRYNIHNSLEQYDANQYHFFLKNRILSSISYIIKNHYFKNSLIWDDDLNKFIKFLKLSSKLDFNYSNP